MRHEAAPTAARLRVLVRRVPGDRGRVSAATVSRPLAGRGSQGVPHGVLLAGVARRQRGDNTEPGKLPKSDQKDTHQPRAGHRRAVRVHDVRQHRRHCRVPGPSALAVRRPRHQRVLLRTVPVGRRRRRQTVLHRVHRRHVRRLRVHRVLPIDHLQVSLVEIHRVAGRLLARQRPVSCPHT